MIAKYVTVRMSGGGLQALEMGRWETSGIADRQEWFIDSRRLMIYDVWRMVYGV